MRQIDQINDCARNKYKCTPTPAQVYIDIIITAQLLLPSLHTGIIYVPGAFFPLFFIHTTGARMAYAIAVESEKKIKNNIKQIKRIQNKLFIAFKSTRAGSTRNRIDDRCRRRRRAPTYLYYILLLYVYRRLYTVRTQYYTYIRRRPSYLRSFFLPYSFNFILTRPSSTLLPPFGNDPTRN